MLPCWLLHVLCSETRADVVLAGGMLDDGASAVCQTEFAGDRDAMAEEMHAS